MKFNTINITLVSVLGAMALAGCGKEQQEPVPSGRQNRIEFGESQTRSGLHKTAATALQMHIVSNYKKVGSYTEGASASSKVLCSATLANAAADGTFTDVPMTYSTVTTEGANVRYWDDLHGRNSSLSIYSIAVPGKNEAHLKSKLGTTANTAWTTYSTAAEGTAHMVSWAVTAAPATASVLEDEDLVYSNNVSGNSALVYVDGTGFEKASSAYGKELVFNHALSRMTINIKKGTGFAADYSDFTVKSVALHGFYTKGTLNVADGTYGTYAAADIADIETVGTKTDNGTAAYKYSFSAQMFPGTVLDDVKTNTLTINIAGNTYNITGDMIAEALKEEQATFSALEQGKNYNISLTLGKTGTEALQARLVDWTDVNGTIADKDITNARLTLELKTDEGKASYAEGSTFALYRAAETDGGAENHAGYAWKTGYNADGACNTVTFKGGKFSLGTDWYWPDNNTCYHLRTVAPAATAVVTDNAGDYFTMTGDTKVAADETDNFTWGAPFKKKLNSAAYTIAYSKEYGFCGNTSDAASGQIHQAIGVTKDTIAITQFYMMSPVNVVLGTTTTSNAVDLSDATVALTDLYNTAKVAMGNGLVTVSGTLQASLAMGASSRTATAASFAYRAVPQTIANTSTAGHIGLVIIASGNKYIVDLTKATVTVDGVKSAISIWNPGVRYTYNITLTKKGIEAVTATLVDWTDINSDNQGIQIE